MDNTPAIRILIADDHPLIRTALKSVINSEPNMTVIGEVGNGRDAVALYFQHQPDVTLMDISMPKMDGLEAIHNILNVYPEAYIIVLTNADSDEDIYRGLAAGARGYLLKDTHHEELLSIIKRVHAGETFVPKKLAERLARRQTQTTLSAREMEVLKQMMGGKNNKAIALHLKIAESTVKSHVKNILYKLKVNDRTQAVVEALRRGIIVDNT